VKGSKVTIFYDGGGQMVAISNLPPDIQRRLNWNPAIAAVNDAIEARQKAAIQQRAQEQAKAVAAAKAKLGPAQTIRVLKVINPSRLQIAANGILAEAYIHNLPLDVINFVQDYNQTKAQAEAVQYANANATYTRQIGQGSHAYNVHTGILTDDAATVMLTRRHLAELEGPAGSHAIACSTVIARPSAYFINPGVRQWEFQAMPAAAGLTP
jgi:hypothetical protein